MLVRRLERDYPAIEDAGCKVGIGVATGADKAFIGPYDQLDVEDDRKLRLAMTRDISSGEVDWRGLGIVNPFGEDGRLVDLDELSETQSLPGSAPRTNRRSPCRKEITGQLVPDHRPDLPFAG